jgi:regulatory protein YycI of two-component signal transduction system YycFG
MKTSLKRLAKQMKKLKDNLKKMNEIDSQPIKLSAQDISSELAAFMRGIMEGIRIGHG